MAHLQNEPTNRYERAIFASITKAQAVDIQRNAAAILKSQAAIEKRLSENEAAILSAVQKIGRRLDALEKVSDAADPTSAKSLEALRESQRRKSMPPCAW